MTKTNNTNNRNILIIDDDEMILDMITRLLGHAGLRSDICLKGEDGIDLYQKALESGQCYDAVIVDIHLAVGLTGSETIDRIFQINKDAKIISSSGFSDDPLVENYKDFGLSGSLPKPFNRDQLFEVLSNSITIAAN